MTAGSIPQIDLREPDTTVAGHIDEACRTIGFFSIVGHGVDQQVIDDAWDATVDFFALPLEEKLRARHPDPNHPYGFFPAGREALAASLGVATPPDLKESFNLAPPIAHGAAVGGFGGHARIWPQHPRRFRSAWTAYYDAMVALSERLLDLFALALGVDPDIFAATVDHHLSALRGLHYPPLDRAPETDQLRAGVHSDYGTLTVLRPGPGSGGLEVRRAGGLWMRVPPVPGGFVVNLGDMMQRWTNDQWRSTAHRVAVPAPECAADERRHAMAFFHQPNWDATITTLPSCLDPVTGSRYEPVVSGPWLEAKFGASATAE